MIGLGIGIGPAAVVQGRRPGLAAPAPDTTRVSAIGDSWTENNQAVLSRTGSVTPGDDWTLQLAGRLGFAHSTVAGEAGVTQKVVVRAGYGGQKTGTIRNNWLAVTAGQPSRMNDIKLLWPGRNDVPDTGGDAATISGVEGIIGDSATD